MKRVHKVIVAVEVEVTCSDASQVTEKDIREIAKKAIGMNYHSTSQFGIIRAESKRIRFSAIEEKVKK